MLLRNLLGCGSVGTFDCHATRREWCGHFLPCFEGDGFSGPKCLVEDDVLSFATLTDMISIWLVQLQCKSVSLLTFWGASRCDLDHRRKRMRRLPWALRRRDLRPNPKILPVFVRIHFGQAFCGLLKFEKANSHLADLVGRESAYKAYTEERIFWPI